jgi:putative ABC transport system permease protein
MLFKVLIVIESRKRSMNIWKVAISNLRGNTIKSLTVFLCVFGVAALFVSLDIIIGGAQNSLNSGLKRLGADILVLPQGTEEKVESALLMGKPNKAWMPVDTVSLVAATNGVARVSPQIYIQSLYGAPCCAVSEMFIVVFDPATDFSVTPWLTRNLGRNLARGEAIGGSYISTMGEPYLTIYGYNLDLKGTLEPTGMGIDQTLFITLETAADMASSSTKTAVSPLEIPGNQVSAILVKVTDGSNPHSVGLQIQNSVPGVTAIESPNLFGTFRKQIIGLLSGFAVFTSLAWIISAVVVGLVFTMSTSERSRELAILRGLGFKRSYIFRSVWFEAAILATTGSAAGVILTAITLNIFKNYIAGTLGMPFLFPSFFSFVTVFAETLLISLITVTVGVFIPAYRVSRQEPAIAMRG